MTKRKSRSIITEKAGPIIPPFDITKFGSEEDPCFGKHNDPKAQECQICGDFEFCQIVTAENQRKIRAKKEQETEFKDLKETPDLQKIRQFMSKKLQTYSKPRVIRLAIKKFDISKTKAKTLIKNL